MNRPNRLRGVLAAGCVLMAAAAATVIVDSPSSDCTRVHVLETDSDAFYARLARGLTTADYRRWTATLAADAHGIGDPGLARRAHDVAMLAAQMATRPPDAPTADAAPPQYARIAVQFNENLYALAQACPGAPGRIRIGGSA